MASQKSADGKRLAGGNTDVTASWGQLNPDDSRAFRQLTVRIEDNAAGNVSLSADGIVYCGYLKTDESWTFGPNAGTITPQDLYIKGTANDRVTYLGVLA